MMGPDGGAPTTGGNVAEETTDQGFVADVIEASREGPVIAYFTAAWCGPCKTLGPQLESAVAATRGKVKLRKIDIDRNQMVAAQLRVQSIPAVFGFDQGQPVDAFMGAVPQSQINEFVERLAGAADDGGLDEAMDAAETMPDDDAARVFEAVLEEDPENARAMGGLIRATAATGDLDRARAILANVPEKLADDAHVAAAKAALDLAGQAAQAGSAAELRTRIEANPDDHSARFDLAVALSAAGDNEGAVTELLELFRRDREWNDGAAKTQLLTIFDALGPKDPTARTGRRKLSSMIFA